MSPLKRSHIHIFLFNALNNVAWKQPDAILIISRYIV